MNRANGVTNNTMRRIEKRQATMVQRVNAGFSVMQRGMVTAFAGVAALRGAQVLIDASTRIENGLKVAGLAGEQLTKVYDALYDSAQRNAAPLEALTELYGRAALVQKELGVSTEELLGFTDNIAVALRVSGKSASESSGALLQLSQALGSGTVRAEEFNSILEGALPIAQAAAAGLTEAGGSVAKLRQLVVDGKISSEAFFRAFEAGSVILTEKVANAELTVSQQFIRLQNVLVDVAGKFNKATGASSRTGAGLEALAGFIDRVGTAIATNGDKIGWLVDRLGDAANAGASFADMMSGSAFSNLSLALDVDLQTAAAEQEAARFAADTEAMFAEAISGATSMLDEWRAGWGETLPPELLASVDDLTAKVKAGGEEAQAAQAALIELGGTGTPFTEALGHLNTLVSELQRVRGEANATAAAVAQAARPDVSGLPQSYAGQDGMGPPKVAVNPVSLADYAVPASTGGKSGGGKSKADQFATAVANQEREIAALQRKTQLQATLNPLVDDYGYALEKLNAQIELENAATEAGLPLDEQRRGQIEQLASGYAMATSEAARLAEAQDKVRESAEAMGQAGRQALDTLIDGFLDGKDAGEIFSDVLRDIGRSLLNMGINGIGTAFKIPGFATGTNSAPGGLARINEYGGEIVNLPKGAQVIPHDISMQMARAAGNSGGAPSFTYAPTIDARGADTAAVARLEQVMARQQSEFEGRVKQVVRGKGTKWR